MTAVRRAVKKELRRVAADAIAEYNRDLPRRVAALAVNPDGGKLTDDELLRRQCLEWAFQTREFSDVPHMRVVQVAREYYDFIRNTDAERQVRAYQARGAGNDPR